MTTLTLNFKSVRLSRLLFGFWMHFKSLHFIHSFINLTEILTLTILTNTFRMLCVVIFFCISHFCIFHFITALGELSHITHLRYVFNAVWTLNICLHWIFLFLQVSDGKSSPHSCSSLGSPVLPLEVKVEAVKTQPVSEVEHYRYSYYSISYLWAEDMLFVVCQQESASVTVLWILSGILIFCEKHVLDVVKGLLCSAITRSLSCTIHPSGVGKWGPALAGKQKAVMVHFVSGWTQGVRAKLWDPLKTR